MRRGWRSAASGPIRPAFRLTSVRSGKRERGRGRWCGAWTALARPGALPALRPRHCRRTLRNRPRTGLRQFNPARSDDRAAGAGIVRVGARAVRADRAGDRRQRAFGAVKMLVSGSTRACGDGHSARALAIEDWRIEAVRRRSRVGCRRRSFRRGAHDFFLGVADVPAGTFGGAVDAIVPVTACGRRALRSGETFVGLRRCAAAMR